MFAYARDRVLHRAIDVGERAEGVRGLGTRFGEDARAQRRLIGVVQAAIRMVHEHDLTRLQQTLREHQRAQHIVGDEPARVAHDVRLARIEPEDAEDVDA